MLADQFPAIVVGGVDLRVGRIEKRDVVLKPLEIAVVPKALGFKEFAVIEDGSC